MFTEAEKLGYRNWLKIQESENKTDKVWFWKRWKNLRMSLIRQRQHWKNVVGEFRNSAGWRDVKRIHSSTASISQRNTVGDCISV